jgi:TM2 domain
MTSEPSYPQPLYRSDFSWHHRQPDAAPPSGPAQAQQARNAAYAGRPQSTDSPSSAIPVMGQAAPQYSPDMRSWWDGQRWMPVTPPAFGGKSKTTAGILAILLGGLGAHKFYLGQVLMGLLYLLFCWTFILALVAFIEGIIFLTLPDDDFQSRYGTSDRALRRPLLWAISIQWKCGTESRTRLNKAGKDRPSSLGGAHGEHGKCLASSLGPGPQTSPEGRRRDRIQ